MDLETALDARSGTVCVVGAGGKKTTLYTLANRLGRAVVTATVRIPIFDNEVGEVRVTDDPAAALRDVDADATAGGDDGWPLGLVPGRDKSNGSRGYDRETVDALGDAAADADPDVPVLVKADGARTRDLKAPNDDEPQIPGSADVVLPIASVHAVGEPLDEETVHRPERVASLTGLSPGDEIRPADVAEVLASPEGGLKDVPPAATPVPVVNMVDDASYEATAREIAAGVHERADVPRVVLTRMVAEHPVVGVVEA